MTQPASGRYDRLTGQFIVGCAVQWCLASLPSGSQLFALALWTQSQPHSWSILRQVEATPPEIYIRTSTVVNSRQPWHWAGGISQCALFAATQVSLHYIVHVNPHLLSRSASSWLSCWPIMLVAMALPPPLHVCSQVVRFLWSS